MSNLGDVFNTVLGPGVFGAAILALISLWRFRPKDRADAAQIVMGGAEKGVEIMGDILDILKKENVEKGDEIKVLKAEVRAKDREIERIKEEHAQQVERLQQKVNDLQSKVSDLQHQLTSVSAELAALSADPPV